MWYDLTISFGFSSNLMSKGAQLIFQRIGRSAAYCTSTTILACTYPKRPRCRQCRARRIGLEDLKNFRILLVYIVKQVTRLIILSAAWFSSYSEVKFLCYSGQIIEPKKKFFFRESDLFKYQYNIFIYVLFSKMSVLFGNFFIEIMMLLLYFLER